MTHYKVVKILTNKTIIDEFWDGLVIKEYMVNAQYNGGDIQYFIDTHSNFCSVNYENLQKYLDNTMVFPIPYFRYE